MDAKKLIVDIVKDVVENLGHEKPDHARVEQLVDEAHARHAPAEEEPHGGHRRPGARPR